MSRQEHTVYRLLDANLNRAVEGMRVLEDAARMLLDDTNATETLKAMRHDLATVVASDPVLERALVDSRSSETDILRDDLGESTVRRPDVASVARANISRAREALRTIEEFAKLCSPELSATAKRLRFCLYDMEPDILARLRSMPYKTGEALRIALEFTLSCAASSGNITSVLPSIADAGVVRLVIRNDVCADGDFAHAVKPLVSVCRANGMVLTVADRLDLALTSGADGVELTHDGLAPEDCRRIAGNGFAVGLRFDGIADLSGIPLAEYDYCVADEKDVGMLRRRGANCVVARYQSAGTDAAGARDIEADGVVIIADAVQIDQIRDSIGVYASILTSSGCHRESGK